MNLFKCFVQSLHAILLHTVSTRISATVLIKFFMSPVWRLFKGGTALI